MKFICWIIGHQWVKDREGNFFSKDHPESPARISRLTFCECLWCGEEMMEETPGEVLPPDDE